MNRHSCEPTCTGPIAPHPVVYSAYRRRLRTGDIALARSDGHWPDRLIAWGTGSPYVHATMIGWCGDVLMLAEARQWRESHLVTLSSQVKRWPGLYDVYRVRRPFQSGVAWNTMVRATGTPYGWRQLLAVALGKVLGLRGQGPRAANAGPSPCGAWPYPQNDSAEDYPRDCSALVNFACRAGGRVPRLELPDARVEPGHFADPAFARYLCTLVWEEFQILDLRPRA
ncbi:MAG: hypothetical protein ABSG86_23420 [Thermoguttaceae bacterium]|jgi:hypothetical protein